MENLELAFNLAQDASIPGITSIARKTGEAVADEEIIAKIGDGDFEAYGILIKRYENFVYTLARGLAGSDEPAKDIAQETFLRAYKALRRFEKKSSFKTWLYRIAYNTALNHIKKNKVFSEPVDFDALPACDNHETIPLRITIRKLIDRLKPEHEAIIIMHYFEDLKYEEMADVLSCPIGTVKIRLYRAKLELKDLWEKYAR